MNFLHRILVIPFVIALDYSFLFAIDAGGRLAIARKITLCNTFFTDVCTEYNEKNKPDDAHKLSLSEVFLACSHTLQVTAHLENALLLNGFICQPDNSDTQVFTEKFSAVGLNKLAFIALCLPQQCQKWQEIDVLLSESFARDLDAIARYFAHESATHTHDISKSMCLVPGSKPGDRLLQTAASNSQKSGYHKALVILPKNILRRNFY